jgi:hypothetical protein
MLDLQERIFLPEIVRVAADFAFSMHAIALRVSPWRPESGAIC